MPDGPRPLFPGLTPDPPHNPADNTQTHLGRQGVLAVGAVAVLAVALFAQLLGVQTFDPPLQVAVYALAVAVPCLAAAVWWGSHPFPVRSPVAHRLTRSVGMLGLLAGVFAAGGAFWHFSWVAGVVFAALTVLLLACHLAILPD